MRKSIGNKIRFEVFKRDSFSCQYCGQQAPDVVLQVDHINPVSSGGDNDLFNLITACSECNSGKGAVALDDNSTIERQKRQLDELNERRAQLEMMLEWREGLRGLDETQIDAFCAEFERMCDGYSVNSGGRSEVARWLKKFSLQELLDALDGSVGSYLRRLPDGSVNPGCLTKVFSYVPRVARCQKKGGQSVEERQLYYIRGILRNRIHVNERIVMELLRTAYVMGCELDSLTNYAKTVKNWTQFREGVEQFIEMEREANTYEKEEE